MNYEIQEITGNVPHYYRTKEFSFPYIKHNEYEKLKNSSLVGTIIVNEGVRVTNEDEFKKEGYVDLRQSVDNSLGHIYELDKKTSEFNKLIGYACVGENTYVQVEEKRHPLFFILLYGILFGISSFLWWPMVKPTSKDVSINKPPVEIADGEVWDGELPENGKQTEASAETIIFAGYSNMYFTTDNDSLALVNPKENTVYMVYSLIKDNKTLYESKGIKPGQMITVNVGDYFSTGTHDVVMQISTYDINNYARCNGAEQAIKITIE